jgi:hypothetical protein
MPTCTGCKVEKPADQFAKDARRKSGLYRRCKSCNKAYRDANAARVSAYMKNWSLNNKARKRLSDRAYYKAHKHEWPEMTRRWKRANQGKVNANEARRRAAKVNATPPWVDPKDIMFVYEIAKMFDVTVDHIYPLRGKNSCGLHVPWNLQLMPGVENSAKGNMAPEEYERRKFAPEQGQDYLQQTAVL